MRGKIILILLVLASSGCATKLPEWYIHYGIPDRAALSKEESIPKLIKALDDENPEIRSQATERLGLFGPDAKDAIDKLYYMSNNDISGTVRVFSQYALKEILGVNYKSNLNSIK